MLVIQTEFDYNAALARIDTLMDAKADSKEGEELLALTVLVNHYEDKRWITRVLQRPSDAF